MKKPYNLTKDYLSDCEKLTNLVISAIEQFSEEAIEEPRDAKRVIVAPVLMALLSDHFEFHFYNNQDDIDKFVNHFYDTLSDWCQRPKVEVGGIA